MSAPPPTNVFVLMCAKSENVIRVKVLGPWPLSELLPAQFVQSQGSLCILHKFVQNPLFGEQRPNLGIVQGSFEELEQDAEQRRISLNRERGRDPSTWGGGAKNGVNVVMNTKRWVWIDTCEIKILKVTIAKLCLARPHRH